MKNSILYLTYDGLSDPLGQSQILPYLEGLAEEGYEITVISFEKNELKAESKKLKVIPLKYHKSPPVLSTLYDIYRLRQEVKKVFKTHRIDIIHCRSYITSLVGLLAKRRFGVKFIFDMRGFWADERVEGSVWNLNNPLFRWVYSYFKGKEKQFIDEADAVVSLTDNAKQEIESWMVDGSMVQLSNGSIAERITVIPTCADLNHFSSSNVSVSETNYLRNKYGLQKDDFVLLYLGSLGTWYMLKEMLDFYEELKTEREKVEGKCRFLFVTRDHEVLPEALVNRDFLNDEIIVTSSSREDVPKYISLCSASIFFIIPTYSKKASAATKMGEIMAMGKPVITNTGWGDVDKILSQKNGVVIKSFDQKDYKKGIGELDERLTDDPDTIRQTAKKYFSLENGVNKFHQIYQKLKKE